jgi:septum site-determining protein MinD
MNKSKKILITSCKGGVGKSSVAANLAFAVAKRGKRVLLCDFDLSNRSLDMFLGYEDRVLYDICDLADMRVDVSGAVLTDPRCENLFFIAAPFLYRGKITSESLGSALDRAADELNADLVMIDTSGGADRSVGTAAPLCSTALIITLPEPCALRAAEKTAMLLDDYGIDECKLVINCFDLESKTAASDIISAIDRTGTSIIGVIPKDSKLSHAQINGKFVFEEKKAVSAPAFENVAARLDGEHVPLFNKMKVKRRKFFK